MADRKDTQGSVIFFLIFFGSEKEAMFFSYHDTKGETSIANGLYHICLKTARLQLPSSEQVFLDLLLLQFSYSKRFVATPKQGDGV